MTRDRKVGRDDLQTICHILYVAGESPDFSERAQRAAKKARHLILPALGDIPACSLILSDNI